MTTSDLLTTGEVAAMFRVSTSCVQRWAFTGRLPSILTPGGRRRFRADEVRALLAFQPVDDEPVEESP